MAVSFLVLLNGIKKIGPKQKNYNEERPKLQLFIFPASVLSQKYVDKFKRGARRKNDARRQNRPGAGKNTPPRIAESKPAL